MDTSPRMERSSALDVVAVVDRSGSMQGSKMEQLKATLRVLVEKGLSSRDRLGLVTFDSTVDTPLPKIDHL